MSEVVKIQFRRGSSAEWLSSNPKLSKGELGLDLTTSTLRIGDGLYDWSDISEIVKPQTHHPFSFLG